VLVFVVVKMEHERNLALSHSENVSTQFKAQIFYVVCVIGIKSEKKETIPMPISVFYYIFISYIQTNAGHRIGFLLDISF